MSGEGVKVTWKRLDVGSAFLPRDGHCACACGGKMFVFGGVVQKNSNGEHQETNELLVFDPAQGTFERVKAVGSIPSPRSAATFAAVGSCLYLFGGLSNNIGWLNDLYMFDTETNTWSKPTVTGNSPSPRDKLASAVVDNLIYVYGGFGPKASHEEMEDDDDDDEEDEEVCAVKAQQTAAHFGWFDDLFIFNTAANSWSHPMHMNVGGPTPRAAHTLCAVGKKLIIFGGRDSESRTDDLHVYDTTTRKWVAGPITCRQLEPRSFHAACAVGSKVIVTGGRGLKDQHFGDFHIFDIDSKAWVQPSVEGDVVPARGAHSLVSLNDSIVLFGGSSNFRPDVGHCTQYYNDIYIMKTDDLPTPAAPCLAVGEGCSSSAD